MIVGKNIDSALRVAEFLLQIKAVKLNTRDPYTWASGIKSPIYCDNRRILSYPRIRTFVRQEMVRCIDDSFGKPDVVAGVATGGIAMGVIVAQELGLPFVYVRPKPKEHGLTNQIEGVVESGQSVIVIEDLVSSGKSSLGAVEALRDGGCMVKGMLSIMTYNLPIAEDNFRDHKCQLVSLTDYEVLIKKALETGYINESDVEILENWKASPKDWNPA